MANWSSTNSTEFVAMVNTAVLNASNVTSCDEGSYYLPEQYISQGICMMIMICFGVPANIVNILVFTHSSMRRQSIINWYLSTLSCADLAALLCSLCMFSIPVIAEWTQNYRVSNMATEALLYAYPIGLTAQMASVYSTICVSAHRFIVVWMPYQAHRFCSKRMAKRNIAAVILFSVIYNIPRWLELKLLKCYSPKRHTKIFSVDSSDMRRNEVYFQGYYTYCYSIVMLVVPFALLIVMNSLVIFSVHKSRKRHQSSDIIARQEAAKERRTTMMLLGVVFIFLFCNVLALYNNFYEMQKEPGAPMDETLTSRLMIEISNILVVANTSVNIFVYLCFSDKYLLVLRYYLKMPFRTKDKDDGVTLEKLLTTAGGT